MKTYYLRDYRGPVDRGYHRWLFLRHSKDLFARFIRILAVIYFLVYLPFLFFFGGRVDEPSPRPSRQVRPVYQRDILHPVFPSQGASVSRQQLEAGGFSARR